MKVSLNDLVKKFPASDSIAVNHVSLEINDGELMVFLGPSGCGKTTTMRMIAGLEMPDSGQIKIGERDVTFLAPKDRRVAMVFQNFSMYPSMTVFENIAFPLQVLKLSKAEIQQQVNDAAAIVGIGHLLKRSFRQVSGGEAQRVALARAMVRRPEVFLMDEPLSSLDAKLRVQLRTEIKRLHQETRSTIVFVTHDQEEAMSLGDKIVVMSKGEIQQMGTPQDVFFKPDNVFVANFVGTPSMNIFDATIQRADGGLCVDLGGLTQPVPAHFPSVSAGQAVKWGVRPEAIKFSAAPSASAVPGQVELIESLGSRQEVFVRAAGKLFSVILDALLPVRIGQSAHLRFEPDSIHLFDAQSGLSLASKPQPKNS
ncbi:MAG: ABC transporter ATP-binding protein [Chloroflexi bacterium]|nr:ABC transporter ATP-binding protein [Chloroflexota bacterium]